MLQPYERLKKVFGGHVDRLARRFGINADLAYKWMRDTDELGTGRPNPLQRVRDLIDEAFLVDRSGMGARLIASDALEYYQQLTGASSDDLNQKEEVNLLLSKTADVVCQLNIHDIGKMSRREQKELSEKLSDVCGAVERIKTLLSHKESRERPIGKK